MHTYKQKQFFISLGADNYGKCML